MQKMVCSISNSPPQLILSKAASFPSFSDNFLTGTFVIYTDIIIRDSAAGTTTANFQVSAYASSDTSNNRLGQASGAITISDLRSPPIYDTTFNTKSFNQRLCRVGDQCMFYLYLKPHSSAAAGIDRMVFTVPKEFKYQPITELNNCEMRGFTSISTLECSTSVNLSVFRINYRPASYDAAYKIITLADS